MKMSLIDHAKQELSFIGSFDKDSDYNGMIGSAVLELIEVFSKQGHSGFSASIVSDLFDKLSRYKTLSPITGEESEWCSVTNDLFQNKRNHAVFKDGKYGRAYFIDAFIKKTSDGDLCHGSLRLKDGRFIGKCYIKDFNIMPTIIIKTLEREVKERDWETWIENEDQLEELSKYYDFERIQVID
jgi:hypothetical protein